MYDQVNGSAMTIEGPCVHVRNVGTKCGRLGGYLDDAAVVLSSLTRSFDIRILTPAATGDG
jgi:hypothetical protein